MKPFTAAEISKICNGRVEGDLNKTVIGIGTIQHASSNQISFFSNPKYEEFVYSTQAGILLLSNKFTLIKPIQSTIIWVEDAYFALSLIMNNIQTIQLNNKLGIEEQVYIHSSALIGENVYIGSFSYISENTKIGNNSKIFPNVFIENDVVIGDNCIIHSGVKIYANSMIGSNVIIHSNSVIGSDGFGFTKDQNGDNIKIPQIGNVIIEDFVEIGACVTIDRGTISSTHIHKRVKIDNLVQIAHNVIVGENTLIAAQTGISGSTKIGSNCIFGGQVGIAGHLEITNNTNIAGKSGLAKSIKNPYKNLRGIPAMNFVDYQRLQVLIRNLPKLYEQFEKLTAEKTTNNI